eukprot:1308945-Lingulodinium_polyedra.AAC.1
MWPFAHGGNPQAAWPRGAAVLVGHPTVRVSSAAVAGCRVGAAGAGRGRGPGVPQGRQVGSI